MLRAGAGDPSMQLLSISSEPLDSSTTKILRSNESYQPGEPSGNGTSVIIRLCCQLPILPICITSRLAYCRAHMAAGGKEMPRVGPGKNIRAMDLLLSLAVLAVIASPSGAQYACTTNYCVKSQSTAFQIPPGWPSVTIETCCRTRWGALPGGMDWNNGAPIMICTGNEEYATAYPNCGDPQNISQDFPLAYEKPKIGIGVAWPNAKDYRYEVESIPIIDGSDGTCAQYSTTPGKVAAVVGLRAQATPAWLICLYGQLELSSGRKRLFCRSGQLQARTPLAEYRKRKHLA